MNIHSNFWQAESLSLSRQGLVDRVARIALALPVDVLVRAEDCPIFVIRGFKNCGKAIIADGLVLALKKQGNPFDVPQSDKMLFEKETNDAAYWGGVQHTISTKDGGRLKICFNADHGYLFHHKTPEQRRQYFFPDTSKDSFSSWLTSKFDPRAEPNGLIILSVGGRNEISPDEGSIFFDLHRDPAQDEFSADLQVQVNDNRLKTPQMQTALCNIG